MTTLELSLLISLASLGARAVTDKNMIFYFLRKPFDRISKNIDELESELERLVNANVNYEASVLYKHDLYKIGIRRIALYIMKPVFMCSTCMASLHTLLWFPILTGELFTYKLIIVMLIVSFFNTVGWLLVNVMRKFISL